MNAHARILVVDDDQEDHAILLEYFKDCGNAKDVMFFRNGQEAIHYLEHLGQDASLPKLIVLDLNMPVLNGTQTLLQIKGELRLRHIPVIIFSTSENENEKKKCLSFGAHDYLVKPSTVSEGQRMIERFLSFLS